MVGGFTVVVSVVVVAVALEVVAWEVGECGDGGGRGEVALQVGMVQCLVAWGTPSPWGTIRSRCIAYGSEMHVWLTHRSRRQDWIRPSTGLLCPRTAHLSA
jgi:hypothetical protein